MADEFTEFWRRLLEHGSDDAEKKLNWNRFCRWRFKRDLKGSVPDEQVDDLWEQLGVFGDVSERDLLASGMQELVGDYKSLKEDKIAEGGSVIALMDFSEEEFPDDISFAGRLLIRADFRNAVFLGRTNFGKAHFAWVTHFEGARFEDGVPTVRASCGHVSFASSVFHRSAYFGGAQLPQTTWFDKANFNSAACFCKATFGPCSGGDGSAVFRDTKFSGLSDFTGAAFNHDAGFERVTFQGEAKFTKSCFKAGTSFNDAEFKSTTSFRNASFGSPPKFFNTKIHEDVNFSMVDWSEIVRSYSRRRRRDEDLDRIEERAEVAIRAWDRLALIMGKQEKLPERHEFFRLMMRARRQRDGHWCLPSIANWLFDGLSDYGWGIGRAFFWWFIHIIAGALLLTIATNCPLMAWNSLLVSFANAHAILGLASDGGHLEEVRKVLNCASKADWVFSAVGTFQAIVGPILLFLVLLTLRNRFRLG